MKDRRYAIGVYLAIVVAIGVVVWAVSITFVGRSDGLREDHAQTGPTEPSTDGVVSTGLLESGNASPDSDLQAQSGGARDLPTHDSDAESMAHGQLPIGSRDKPAIGWPDSYGDMSLAQLISLEESLSSDLAERTNPELMKRLQAGLGEDLGTGTSTTITDNDPMEISSYYMLSGGRGTYKVTLPKDEYPELYAQKAQLVALRELISGRKELQSRIESFQKGPPID